MNIELLKKYCTNVCTEKELISVLEWFEGQAKSPEGKDLLYKLWEELPEEECPSRINYDHILDMIHHKVNLDHTKRLLEESDNNIIIYNRRKRFINTFVRAAAILLIPVLCLGLYMTYKYHSAKFDQSSVNQAYNEVFSSEDAITKVTLPDGSNVWLNHNSSLKYPSLFHGDTRNVELKGEGYFEVSHNPKVPFIVRTDEIKVKAIGTEFNIMAYPDEDRIETSLIEGRVDLIRTDADGKCVPLLNMKPSDLAIFNKQDNKVSTSTIIDDRDFSWKEGRLVFNKEPLGEVAKKLSRWFNVDIEVKDPRLLDLTYTATFVHETLPQVMELITMITPVNYTITNREATDEGTFTKRKVILRYKKK